MGPDEAERARLGAFVAELRGGRSLVLLGSRGPEGWLTDPAAVWRYELPGLDPDAATALAERGQAKGVVHWHFGRRVRWRTAGRQMAPVIVRTRGHRLEGIWHAGSPMAGIIIAAVMNP